MHNVFIFLTASCLDLHRDIFLTASCLDPHQDFWLQHCIFVHREVGPMMHGLPDAVSRKHEYQIRLEQPPHCKQCIPHVRSYTTAINSTHPWPCAARLTHACQTSPACSMQRCGSALLEWPHSAAPYQARAHTVQTRRTRCALPKYICCYPGPTSLSCFPAGPRPSSCIAAAVARMVPPLPPSALARAVIVLPPPRPADLGAGLVP